MVGTGAWLAPYGQDVDWAANPLVSFDASMTSSFSSGSEAPASSHKNGVTGGYTIQITSNYLRTRGVCTKDLGHVYY